MPKKKLSKTGHYLFNQAYDYSNDKNIKKNYGCIKKLLHDLFSSNYDLELEEIAMNMKASSFKIFSFIKNHNKIKILNRTAIYNIILLIITNGEYTISPQKVKYNIQFYLDLAVKSMKDNDHQTAILIKAALENKYISDLNIKYNNSMIKKIEILSEKYGYYSELYINHLTELIKKYLHTYYIPSTLVLNLNLENNFKNKNSNYFESINYKLNIIKSEKHEQYKFTPGKLCPIYNTNPLSLSSTKNILEENKIKDTDFDIVMNKLLNKYLLFLNYRIKLSNK